MTLSPRTPEAQRTNLCANTAQDAFARLNLSQDATPQYVVRVLNETLASMRRGYGPFAQKDDGVDVLLGCLFAEQLVREYGWDWIDVIDANSGNSNARIAVANPDRSWVIYPIDAAKDCIDGNVDSKFSLVFNMINQPGEIPDFPANSLIDLMQGVHHVFPPLDSVSLSSDRDSSDADLAGHAAFDVSLDFLSQNSLLLNSGEAPLLHNELRAVIYGGFSRKRFVDVDQFTSFAQTVRVIADGWYNAFDVASLDLSAMVNRLDSSARIESPRAWLANAKRYTGSLRDWLSHYNISVDPSDIPRHITGDLYWVGDSLDFEMIADCPKYFAQIFVSWH